jgi:predicted RNA-binding Zn-ribbon protein involved in translation (DUF1610 family)
MPDIQKAVFHSCPGCGNQIALTYRQPLDGMTFLSDVQRVARCPQCGSQLAPAPAAHGDLPTMVRRWFAALPDTEQQQIFEDLARLRAQVGSGGAA